MAGSEIDPAVIAAFWQRGQAAGAIPGDRAAPDAVEHEAFAWDEGEGDRTRATWLADHEAYFRRELARLGLDFDDEMPTVFERFELVYTEEARHA